MRFGDIAGRVLVVDKDESLCRLYKYALEKSGIGAQWVLSARDAEAAMEHGDFSLALVDIHLSSDDGPSLADRLVSIDPKLSVILMTASEATQDLQSNHPVIQKPSNIHSVVERVMVHLTMRWLRLSLVKLDERVATYTMSNMVKEFFDDPRGKLLCLLLGSICTYAVARGEGFVSRLEQLEHSSVETVTLLKRLDGSGKIK